MDLQAEKTLLAQARKDPAAFGRLYDDNYARIFNYVLRRTGSIETAEDITADTFFKVLKNLWQFQWRNIPFSAWLYKIATNELRAFYRKGGVKTVSLDFLREQDGFEPASADDPEAELLAAQEVLDRYRDFLACRQKLAELPVQYQEVISLRFFEGKQIKEIGLILGKPEGTVKSLLHRGLEKLKKMMEEGRKNATF